ncbi:hypothetical protein Goarm_007655, partial [Gossypium armourianum]|nr:hypothetical protein [Gossypium armourianum]
MDGREACAFLKLHGSMVRPYNAREQRSLSSSSRPSPSRQLRVYSRLQTTQCPVQKKTCFLRSKMKVKTDKRSKRPSSSSQPQRYDSSED